MLVNEEDIVLEARVQMRLEAEFDDNGVVVAVDVGVDTVEALEHVSDESRERLGEGDLNVERGVVLGHGHKVREGDLLALEAVEVVAEGPGDLTREPQLTFLVEGAVETGRLGPLANALVSLGNRVTFTSDW